MLIIEVSKIHDSSLALCDFPHPYSLSRREKGGDEGEYVSCFNEISIS
jgi:hypothetical protein